MVVTIAIDAAADIAVAFTDFAAAVTAATSAKAAAVATIVEGANECTTVRLVCVGGGCCCCCCGVRRRAVNFTNSIILARAVVSASWPTVACVQLDLIGEIVVKISLCFLGYCIFGNGLES